MKRASKVNQKAFFINLKWFSFAKNCLRPKSAPLTFLNFFFLVVAVQSYMKSIPI